MSNPADTVSFQHAGALITVPAETITSMWLDRLRGHTPPVDDVHTAIGSRLYTGVFMGVVRLDDGKEYGVIDLGEAPNRMKWADATKWAEEKGGQLPPRRAQALMFANRAEDQFQKAWYWSCEQYAGYGDCAWFQGFGAGGQLDGLKDHEYFVRAVRLVDASVIR